VFGGLGSNPIRLQLAEILQNTGPIDDALPAQGVPT
jgi:hypothetical protein